MRWGSTSTHEAGRHMAGRGPHVTTDIQSSRDQPSHRSGVVRFRRTLSDSAELSTERLSLKWYFNEQFSDTHTWFYPYSLHKTNRTMGREASFFKKQAVCVGGKGVRYTTLSQYLASSLETDKASMFSQDLPEANRQCRSGGEGGGGERRKLNNDLLNLKETQLFTRYPTFPERNILCPVLFSNFPAGAIPSKWCHQLN